MLLKVPGANFSKILRKKKTLQTYKLSSFQPLDFLIQTYKYWFTEVPVPLELQTEGSKTHDVQLKIWFSLTCKVKFYLIVLHLSHSYNLYYKL